MGIFGWDYPPGCNSTPYDDEPPCVMCFELVDNCKCEECPKCGEVGNPACYEPESWDMTTRTGHGLKDPRPVKCLEDLFLATGTMFELDGGAVDVERSFKYLDKTIYNGTACGAWINKLDADSESHWMGGVIVGSIVEGADQCTDQHQLWFPICEMDLWNALEEVERQATEIWNDTHGCEHCWPDGCFTEWGEAEFGNWPINPDCKVCKGQGVIL